MGSKKYKGKLCPYCCERQSTDGEHIFSRKFFLVSRRATLPKAPSCSQCNKDKSDLEHYLTAVLPFGGRHVDTLKNLTGFVPDRLAKNVRLHRHLDHTRSRVLTLEGGIYQPTMAILINSGAIERLFTLIVRGLVWHHWNTYFADEHHIEALFLTETGKEFFEQYLFSMNAAQRVKVDLGNGTFTYEGMQAVDCPQITVWRFEIYGGLVLDGDPDAPNESSTQVGVLSGPRRTWEWLSKPHFS